MLSNSANPDLTLSDESGEASKRKRRNCPPGDRMDPHVDAKEATTWSAIGIASRVHINFPKFLLLELQEGDE